MACPTETFSEISEFVFVCLKDLAESRGVDVPDGDNGLITFQGVSGTFQWIKTAQILRITVIQKPDNLTCNQISDVLRRAVIHCNGNV